MRVQCVRVVYRSICCVAIAWGIWDCPHREAAGSIRRQAAVARAVATLAANASGGGGFCGEKRSRRGALESGSVAAADCAAAAADIGGWTVGSPRAP